MTRFRTARAGRSRSPNRDLPGTVLAIALIASAILSGCSSPSGSELFSPRHDSPVGRLGPNIHYTPANQLLTPEGVQVPLPGMRPQAIALSPDGRLLVTAGRTHEIVVLEPSSGKILQRVPLPGEATGASTPEAVSTHQMEPDKEGQLSYTGLVFSPDGSRVYLANVNGSIKVFSVRNGRVEGSHSIPLPRAAAPRRDEEIPSGIAVSKDGKRLYVALNLSNQLAEIDAASGRILRVWEVGVAPFDVVLAGTKVYVSNWGGRRPDRDSLTGPAGRGTFVRVDPVRHIASEGSVSVIDLSSITSIAGPRKSAGEILTGLHASAMALSPDGRWLAVANAGSDTISVIDTRTDAIVETIWTRQSPADLFGAQPNALAFDRAGRTLYVCNGTHNAVATISFRPGQSRLRGLIPVGWFPGAIVHDSRRSLLHVANIKGMGSEKQPARGTGTTGFNTKQYQGSLSIVPVPSSRALRRQTGIVLHNMRYPLLAEAMLPPRPDQPPRPVPERAGEPSVFQHVIYIIKENRTYDQVLGDMKEGNGDPALCIFGEHITPNQHKLAREFVLLDNTYCSGILSADGHNWSDSAIATEYVERSFAGWPRSYPDGADENDVDAIAYSPAGFIWDNALARGKTIRHYGEFTIGFKRWKDPARKEKPKFLDCYRDFVNGTDEIAIWSEPAIESIRPYMCTNTIGWDMDVPDVFRAQKFLDEFREFERTGNLPNFIIMWLPNDHTSGTSAGSPTPAAQVADNDLAFARIVEAVSHSRFWTNTVIIAIEDDPQDGWDHVSGYRTTCYIASPYTKRGEVISTHYNQTSVLRTIELILGLPPMHQLDATATPMRDCFTSAPDFTPFKAVPNNVPLDQMNPDPKRISDPLLRRNALASARLPLDEADKCPEDEFNRILWHAMKGSEAIYPEWAVRQADDDDD